MMAKEKRCMVCGQERSEEDFGEAVAALGGRKRVCEMCEMKGYPTIEVKIASMLERIANSLDRIKGLE